MDDILKKYKNLLLQKRYSGIDFDTEMKRIQKDFRTLLVEEKDSQNQLINAFKTLGYEL